MPHGFESVGVGTALAMKAKAFEQEVAEEREKIVADEGSKADAVAGASDGCAAGLGGYDV